MQDMPRKNESAQDAAQERALDALLGEVAAAEKAQPLPDADAFVERLHDELAVSRAKIRPGSGKPALSLLKWAAMIVVALGLSLTAATFWSNQQHQDESGVAESNSGQLAQSSTEQLAGSQEGTPAESDADLIEELELLTELASLDLSPAELEKLDPDLVEVLETLELLEDLDENAFASVLENL